MVKIVNFSFNSLVYKINKNRHSNFNSIFSLFDFMNSNQ